VLDERCLAHVNPSEGAGWARVEPFERPERLLRTQAALAASGVLAHVRRILAREATEAELLLAHTPAHVARVLAACDGPEHAEIGDFTFAGPGSRAAALVAVGGLLEAVDAVLGGALETAYVIARPPGHHAERDRPMGFCLFNATAVAARHAQRAHGLERVAIVDWDVHHGNGAEEVFADDPSVLTVSLHQEALYPADTGDLHGRGAAANVNVPLPPGTGDAGYALALDRVVAPVLRAFAPQLVLVGAGQDPAASDPLGRMAVTTDGFRALADRLLALAGELCGARLVAFQEGGYSLRHLPAANVCVLEALAGLPPSLPEDPVGCDVPPGLRDVEARAVALAQAAHVR
jgi:acetoin utilization deacetylase AcuC-like enzyme